METVMTFQRQFKFQEEDKSKSYFHEFYLSLGDILFNHFD